MTTRSATRLLAPMIAPLLAWSSGCGPEYDRDVRIIDRPVRELRVESGNADLEVVGGAPEDVRVEIYRWWTRHRPRVGVNARGDVLMVDYDCRDDQSLCAVHLEIIVPTELDVTVDAADGDVLLSDIDGAITIEGDWSNVWGFRLASPQVDVATGGGDVVLRHDVAPDLLSITTYDGDVEVFVPPGPYDFDVASRRGEVLVSPFIEQDPEAPRRIEITSQWGAVYVRASQSPES